MGSGVSRPMLGLVDLEERVPTTIPIKKSLVRLQWAVDGDDADLRRGKWYIVGWP